MLVLLFVSLKSLAFSKYTSALKRKNKVAQAYWKQIWAHYRQYVERKKIECREIIKDDNLV